MEKISQVTTAEVHPCSELLSGIDEGMSAPEELAVGWRNLQS